MSCVWHGRKLGKMTQPEFSNSHTEATRFTWALRLSITCFTGFTKANNSMILISVLEAIHNKTSVTKVSHTYLDMVDEA